jgi:hypothetical protein
VLLDGSAVQVLIGPRQGPRCGFRATSGSDCHAVSGGFVQTGVVRAESAPGVVGRYAAFYTGDVEIVLSAADRVLEVAALTTLAQHPAWRP